jgi:hypothetical protein
MFVVEGLLATLVGAWAYFYLDDRPADASWLSADEQALIKSVMQQEDSAKVSHGQGVLAAMLHPSVLYFALIYLLIQGSVYGVVFFLPTQVAGLLGTKVGVMVGVVSAIPWVAALLAAWLIPGFADRSQKHRSTAALTLVMAAAGMALSVSSGNPLIGVLGLCFAAAGFIAVQPVFWTFPGSRLSGAAAAGGIAMINSVGNVGGFIAPIVKTWAEASFHSPAAGLYLLSGTTLLAALLVMAIRPGAPRLPGVATRSVA